MNTTLKICKNENCNKTVTGRADRVFCSESCKSGYHYSIRKKSEKTYFKMEVDEILRKNRSILSKYTIKNGVEIPAETLYEEGFNPRFFTHYWKNLSGETFYFCYDQGYKEMKSSFGDRFSLVYWQQEMGRQIFNPPKNAKRVFG